jgi:hypothetical protein
MAFIASPLKTLGEVRKGEQEEIKQYFQKAIFSRFEKKAGSENGRV